MLQHANKKRDLPFEEGDMLYLKIQPYKLKKVPTRLNQKLSSRYYSPYVITAKINAVAYKLKLPEGYKVHPVFHISLLRKSINSTAQIKPLPACLNEEWELQPEPEQVLAVRLNKEGEPEALVK